MQRTLALELVAKWDATMVVDALTEYGIQNVIVQRLVSKEIDAKHVRQLPLHLEHKINVKYESLDAVLSQKS